MPTAAATSGVFRSGTTNLLYAKAAIRQHRFVSTLTVRGLTGIYMTNALAVIASFGLAVPWALVRLARYRAENLLVLADGKLDDFVRASDPAHGLGAVASEAAHAFDFDFGL